ncbi:ABC transporter substrate-binding protein [Paenibacillus sp. SC116]|uniref:ABC transporter substrate-binding protein n=1 Tax=Paenibacillus sp. SC116 TaxID=2968986 RepID=UPI00215A3ECE|nr:ABC transporter substrate-binding protein [Paenibacillus sp. SC116]MCR8844249.1 ABC transporter substrate-binding protein [Paenibacillus sp. SC116]
MNSRKRKWSMMIASLMLLAVLTACGNDTNTDPVGKQASEVQSSQGSHGSHGSTSSSEKSGEQAKETSTPTGGSYKVDEKEAAVLAAQFGDKKPEKAVVVSVSISEVLHGLGVMPVGVPTSTLELPEAFKDVKRIGSAFKPDLEQITSLEPDVVIGPASIKDSLEKTFKTASLKTAYIPSDSLEQLKLSTVALGKVFGKEDKAKEMLDNLAKQEAEMIAKAKGKPAPKVMILFGTAESFMMMNEKTFPGSIAAQLGATNVVSEVLKSDETYLSLNMEDVVTANPDVILLVSHGDPNTALKKFETDVKKNGAWEKLNAFQNGKVKALDYNLFGVASLVKAGEAYQHMFKQLYE